MSDYDKFMEVLEENFLGASIDNVTASIVFSLRQAIMIITSW